VTTLINKWTETRIIDTVTDFEGFPVNPKTQDVRDWMHSPCIIGKKSRYNQIYIDIISQNKIRALAKYQEQFLKKYRVKLSIKRTINEHTAKVGCFAGVNTQFANVTYCKRKVVKKFQYYDKILEIKKEYIFEKDYKSKYLIIHAE